MTNPTLPQPPAKPAHPLVALLSSAGLDWFLFGLLGVVALAYFFPETGSKASPLPWKALTTGGVALIFFFYGLRLSAAKLTAGLRNWRLHTVVQLTTFVLFPLLALAARPFLTSEKGELLWQSIFFLCTLPSTVSTSVVMVGIAGGNLPAAIFNASISSLIGIFVTPLWCSFILHTGTTDGQLGSLVLSLLWQVVLPVAAGVLLNRRFGHLAERHRQGLRTFDQLIILVIVFTSFCDSFAEGVFRSYRLTDILALSAGMVALYFLIFGLVWGLSRLLNFSRQDRIVALFCGSKKSLVHGSVLASLLFPGAALGALLLPLMLYHALQIIMASVMAQRMGRQVAGQAL
ncbi:solute carrier family 10 (sodium/bile acid cotransporter), member 7 [Hymenobacter daecheongensis DSM 21074]|uniref:Solute carrier family 10 (Sodium/bile acid cotransporter), member 7 n=1 Tax=Hymenobacter daecheongensis DSM 21074 TaxID=1121955 RepID=A0A1M6I0A3_9BACT|nr:bile acid:sodium symporter family protein [Hymenobacter daecheongensis]SHJ27801.1 solute carrier family 10 (sodium/bile acid cotransporter), member 7 [Hymenobacter daecheongensis DSM 21074]